MEIPFEKRDVDLEIPNVKECMFFAFNITPITAYTKKIIIVIIQVGGVGD